MACHPRPRDTDAALLQGQSSERWLTAGASLEEAGLRAGAIFCRMSRVRFVAQFIANRF
jgi:hypothetical protein